MRTIHHIADPNFWELWNGHGQGAGVKLTPRLGEKQLDIRLKSGEQLTLSGGTVIAVELVQEHPDAVVSVTMTSAPWAFQLVLLDGFGIAYQGAQDQLQFNIFKRRHERGGTLNVLYDYFWGSPHKVRVAVFDEQPDDRRGFKTDYSSGSMTIEQLEEVLRQPQGAPIELLVSGLIRPNGPTEAEGKLSLPAEVQLKDLRRAGEDLLRFARFACEPNLLKSPKKRQHAA